MDERLKKSINISIQSKKYLYRINSILKEWNKEGLTPSNVVCEDILLGYTISKSASLIKIVKVLEMIESILSMKYDKESIEYQLILEEILSKSISVDMSKINSLISTEILSKLNTENSEDNNSIEAITETTNENPSINGIISTDNEDDDEEYKDALFLNS